MGGTVIVDDRGLPYVQAVSVGPHVFQADEPVEAGGGDEFIAPLVPQFQYEQRRSRH